MAEPINIQQLKDASLDVKSLEEVVNGDENVVVTTRLGETYPSVKGSIKKVFETGGLPAEPFATLAKMETDGVSLPDGQLAMVHNETANNGLYVKTSGSWVKSSYDVKSMAKEVAEIVTTDALTNYFTEPDNLLSFENITRNKMIAPDGAETENAIRFGITDYIPVKENSEYTLKYTAKYATSNIAFYDVEKNFISRSDLIDSADKPEYVFSILIPSDVAYVRFSLNTVSYTKNEIAFYQGEPANLSGYPLYHKPELSSNISFSPELLEDIRYGVMPYDFVGKHVEPTKNIINNRLFTIDGNISGSGEITSLGKYAHTQLIRVNGDTDYVLQTQGVRYALRYVAWYTVDNKFISRGTAFPNDADANHVVLRSPVLARYCSVVSDTQFLDSFKNNVAMYIGDAVDPDFDITDTSAKLIDVTIDSSHGSNESLETNPDIIRLKNSLVSGYNLFNPATAEASTLISVTGEITPDDSYFASDYIPVSEGVYTILGTHSVSAPFTHVSYYTKDKAFIRRVDIAYTYQGSEDSDKLLITIPSGVALVRLNGNIGTAYERNRMFIKGDIPEDTAYDTGETTLTKVKLAQDVRFDARTPRFRTDTDISGTFHTNIVAHEAERPYTRFNSAQVYERYDALAALYPDNIETFELGTDALGNRMAYYKVTAPKIDADMNQKLPLVFINCGLHGGERISTTVMYRIIEQMLTNWRSSDVLQSLKFNMDLLVLPVSNPSGWNTRTRQNHKGVDINRNFPTGWGTQHENSGDSPFSEPESRAIAKVIADNEGIDMFWDFHNFSGGPESGSYTWIPITSKCYPYLKATAKSIISKITHLIQRDYDYVPESWVAGWVSGNPPSGWAQDYAAEQGIPFSTTFELCSYLYPYAEHIDIELFNELAHDEVHSKVMYEATVTALITFLTELQRY